MCEQDDPAANTGLVLPSFANEAGDAPLYVRVVICRDGLFSATFVKSTLILKRKIYKNDQFSNSNSYRALWGISMSLTRKSFKYKEDRPLFRFTENNRETIELFQVIIL